MLKKYIVSLTPPERFYAFSNDYISETIVSDTNFRRYYENQTNSTQKHR